MDGCTVCGRDMCWGGATCKPQVKVIQLKSQDAVTEFEIKMNLNMGKTRMFTFPDNITDPDHRRYLFLEHSYKMAAKEAFQEMIREYY